MPNQFNYHKSAVGLIVAAAEKSGLLEFVAEALCFVDKKQNPSGDCPTCAILEKLADAFDAHCVDVALVIEEFWGGPVGIGPFTKDELAPYLGTPMPDTSNTDNKEMNQ